jgi:uncharacterized protein (UPF0276 family)
MQKHHTTFPALGFGLGLRPQHYPYIFEHCPKIDWFEIISENFMDTDGKPRRNLARICEHYPIVMHGVAMSIGTADPLNSDYLQKLKKLSHDIKPAWISDHLCWTGIAHKNSHDLLPVPYTEEALHHIVTRIKRVQDFLERPIALENPSTYLEFKTSHIPEAEFIAEMAKQSGCNLLLDVNNVYVTCYNHRLDAQAYIDALPLNRVIQIHLSGHTNKGNHIIDTHDDHVVDGVWSLYKYVVNKAGHTPNTMVEWDDHIPEFPVLFAELEKAKIAAADAKNYAPLPNLAKQESAYVPNIMTPLVEAQTIMQDAILQGSTHDSNPNAWIRSKEEFTPANQLGVYVNAYRYRLYDVTAEDYPVLQHYMGNKKFEKLIWGFVNTVPSTHFNVGRFAVKLPMHVQQTLPKDKFALELCELETAISQLTDPPETTPLTPAHLEGMTPEKMMELVLHPRKAQQLFAFEYPVNDYYRMVKEEKYPKKPKKKKSFLAVFRHEDVLWRMDLEEAEHQLLSILFSGQTIGEALVALPEENAPQLSEYFSRWMRNGLLSADEYITEPTKWNIA